MSKQFFDPDYEVPNAADDYFKFEAGKNKLRALSSPVLGWVVWEKDEEEKPIPVRFRMTEKPSDPKAKHFWVFPVWNYALNRIQILEITQIGIMGMIREMERDKDWGNPTDYDLTITRKGEGINSKYSVMPMQPKLLTKEILEKVKAMEINLEAVFDGGNPFTPDEVDEQTGEIIEAKSKKSFTAESAKLKSAVKKAFTPESAKPKKKAWES